MSLSKSFLFPIFETINQQQQKKSINQPEQTLKYIQIPKHSCEDFLFPYELNIISHSCLGKNVRSGLHQIYSVWVLTSVALLLLSSLFALVELQLSRCLRRVKSVVLTLKNYRVFFFSFLSLSSTVYSMQVVIFSTYTKIFSSHASRENTRTLKNGMSSIETYSKVSWYCCVCLNNSEITT